MSAARPASVMIHPSDGSPSRSALLATRLLISSYFLVVGLCLVEDEVLYTLLVPGHLSAFASQSLQVLVLGAAALVAFARFVRPAALFLICFTMAAAFTHFTLQWSSRSLEMVWRELSLIGALLMIALTARPVVLDIGALRGKRNAITPRRIKPDADEELLSRLAEHDAMLAEPDDTADAEAEDAAPQVDRGEISNLFHDLWDEATPIRARNTAA